MTTSTRSIAAGPIVTSFLVILGLLLVGYMFLGRGFAHLAVGPIFVGDAVMVIGIAVAGYCVLRGRGRPELTWTVGLLIGFAALGAVRTVPYVGRYELDALRDGTLWGYAAFALIVYVIFDRSIARNAFRAYGWIVPVFALWLPIAWNLFRILSVEIDPNRPGAVIPLVFFKAGDMAVHVVGALAFLVVGTAAVAPRRTLIWRGIIVLPLLWTVFVAGASNRGALVTVIAGIAAIVVLAPRWRPWIPILAAAVVFAVAVGVQSAFAGMGSVASGSPRASVAAGEPTRSADPSSTAQADETSADDATQSELARATDGRDSSPAATADSDSEPGSRVDIANPGFETFDGGAAVPGWNANAGARVAIVADEPHGGAALLSMQNTLGPYEAALTSDPFRVSGPDIRIRLWAKAIRGEPEVEVYISWYDRSHELISSGFVSALSTDGDPTWRMLGGVKPGPDEAVTARIVLYEASGGGTVGIDDLSARIGDFVPDSAPNGDSGGRPATIGQIVENFLSIFGGSSRGGLEGTRQFRLAWWGTIIDYTIFGDYFWTGKGFGVNLADSDGFQSTADGSLRAPHNTHFTVLARMGVPGFALWLALQATFAIGLFLAVRAHRRAGDALFAAIGAWALAYWVAMMVDTSFDPYLEGPQGGIWFWCVIGIGLVVMSARRAPAE